MSVNDEKTNTHLYAHMNCLEDRLYFAIIDVVQLTTFVGLQRQVRLSNPVLLRDVLRSSVYSSRAQKIRMPVQPNL